MSRSVNVIKVYGKKQGITNTTSYPTRDLILDRETHYLFPVHVNILVCHQKMRKFHSQNIITTVLALSFNFEFQFWLHKIPDDATFTATVIAV